VYVLEILARERLARGELVQVLPGWETSARTFYVVYPKSRFIPPKVRAFADFTASRLAEAEPRERKPVRVRRGGRS
jgi:LysR family transcriptional regulator for bpeEF and oprC